jgi:phage FluMu protein Com
VFGKEVGKRTYEIKCPKCREIDVEYVGEKVVREVVRDGKWTSR